MRRRSKAKEEEETSATPREFTNLDASTGLFRLRPITSISLYRALLLSNEIEALETGRTAGRKPTIDVRRSRTLMTTAHRSHEPERVTDGFCRCCDDESATCGVRRSE
ncbi:hypothetical protein K0M31_000759 [Melipona bicolor]|uniref:Uncharacterized protein n=1 Tax=Melipona bicolor TaxID=60889 RepID=A0AA40GEZ9_9HYME|nr:hypothetical protein K0M31_000759 [Melipona bicolor]